MLPVALPGLATALGIILLYGQFSGLRDSWLFILIGHVLFTLPFMLRPVQALEMPRLEEAAASLGASLWQRFFTVVVPNCRNGILAGAFMVITLSVGEFNITWMLHTPLTKNAAGGASRQLCLNATGSGIGLHADLYSADSAAAADAQRGQSLAQPYAHAC
ncbi:hypothetical protein E05_26200 [Plautia stali symbiont]|nr:hypothetical protein E05_26200 [Plautia stali symbiont]